MKQVVVFLSVTILSLQVYGQCGGSQVDVFGVEMMYPTNSNGASAWEMGYGNWSSRMKQAGNVSGSGSNTVMELSGKERVGVYATDPCDGIPDHDVAEAQGYMCDPKDWRNFEMTAYFYTTDLGGDDFTMYGRGGRHTGDAYPDGCMGSAYKVSMEQNGDCRWGKEQWHVSYDYGGGGGWKNSGVDVDGRWVGMKCIMYNTGPASDPDVVLELWLDDGNSSGSPTNNWKLINKVIDSGGWGSEGSECGGDPDQKITWGGPSVTFRTDAGSIDLKWASVREIDPNATFGMDLTSSVENSCGPDNGRVVLDINGGAGPYTYSWSNGSSGKDLVNIGGGDYTVSVTDVNGCSAIDTVTVMEYAAADPGLVTGTGTADFCEGDSIDVIAQSGFVSYVWSDYLTAPVLPIAPAAINANGDDGNVPGNVSDGDLNTRWSNNGTGSWIALDLGSTKYVRNIEIAWYRGDERISNFDIEVSPDGVNYNQVFSGASSGNTLAPEQYTISPSLARYVRVVVNGNSMNDWASITEMTVNGQSGSTTPQITVGQSGIYTVEVVNQDGCMGTDSIEVTAHPLPPVPVISETGNTLFASPQGYNYQWYKDGQLITGATGDSYTYQTGGDFIVIITDANGCSSTSDQYIVITTGIAEGKKENLLLYPNPASDMLTVTFTGVQAAQLEIVDVLGRVVYVRDFEESGSRSLDISGLPAGTYTVIVATARHERLYRRLVKR